MTKDLKTILEQETDPKLLLTPRINEWMLEHPGNLYTQNAYDRVWAELTKPGRDRSGSFSASSAGQCLRRQEFAFLGKPQKPVFPALRTVFEIGTWTHAQWQALLLSAKLLDDIEVEYKWPRMNSMGSADGVGHVWWESTNPLYRGRNYGVELKTVGEFAWKKKAEEGPSSDHLDQVHRYMLVSGIDLFSYIIIDKGNSSGLGWKEFVIERDPKLIEKSEKELEELNKALKIKKLHPLLTECKIGTGPIYKQCPYGGREGVCKTTKNWSD